ncbi:MAG: hypothetical protein VKO65_01760 [Cyanobacteriota bacterium]|nr:hypothetical protein [Cyanobacteriota bacterium]
MAELSPAARAVLEAMHRSYDHEPTRRAIAAGILRALANHQQAPITLGQPIDHWSPDDHTRRELRNLADELEGGNGQ